MEALIDFGEGEEIEEGVFTQGAADTSNSILFFSDISALIPSGIAHEDARILRDQIMGHLSDNRRGEILRTGIRLAIFGPPNAGKSSLLNYLG